MSQIDDIQRKVNQVVSDGGAWADLDAAASALEETRGSVLGQMVEAFIKGGKAAGAAEHSAKASTMYRQHVTKMVEARRLANRAKVVYELGRVSLDMMRTLEATRRAEMRMGSHVP